MLVGRKDRESPEYDGTSSSSSSTSSSWVLLLQEKDARIRELETQLGLSQRLQTQQKEQVDYNLDRWKKRDADYQALLLQYETDKKVWEDLQHHLDIRHKKEKETLVHDLDTINELLQEQVNQFYAKFKEIINE